MVQTKGTELPTPTQSSNRSLVLESGPSNPRSLRSTLKKQLQDGANALVPKRKPVVRLGYQALIGVIVIASSGSVFGL
jgi:hypothetical protein